MGQILAAFRMIRTVTLPRYTMRRRSYHLCRSLSRYHSKVSTCPEFYICYPAVLVLASRIHAQTYYAGTYIVTSLLGCPAPGITLKVAVLVSIERRSETLQRTSTASLSSLGGADVPSPFRMRHAGCCRKGLPTSRTRPLCAASTGTYSGAVGPTAYGEVIQHYNKNVNSITS